jgi:hypothetical protein
VKFQGAEAPRGECIGFHGPGVGSVSDSAMMHDSRITCDLDEIARRCSHLLGLCGDPARPRSPVTCKPLMAGARETMAQRIHNHLGARTRDCGVEIWGSAAALAVPHGTEATPHACHACA